MKDLAKRVHFLLYTYFTYDTYYVHFLQFTVNVRCLHCDDVVVLHYFYYKLELIIL